MPYILTIIGAPTVGYGLAADNKLIIICGSLWLCTACIVKAIQDIGGQHDRKNYHVEASQAGQ